MLRHIQALPAQGLLTADDVLPNHIEWSRAGSKCALVTLVGIEGATPRPIGAQMAVCEDGQYVGYLSGGCLEQAVAQEAVRLIRSGENKLIRYGKGSQYFDLKLPCGSGLDLYFDQNVDREMLERASRLRETRKVFSWVTNLTDATTVLEPNASDRLPTTERSGANFRRVFLPQPQVLLVGVGPMFSAIACLLSATGFLLDCVSPDDAARDEIAYLGIASRAMRSPDDACMTDLDRFTAAILAFHEHKWEPPILGQLLRTPCFYIGVLGSRTAHANRIAQLATMGFGPDDLQRIRGPVGSIPGAKSRATLAVGVLSELMTEAKAHGLVL